MRIVNLTAHEVVVMVGADVLARWDGHERPARLVENVTDNGVINTASGPVPLRRIEYSQAVVGLPAPRPGVAIVVSRVLAAAVPRPDLYFPWGEVRDTAGKIIGCRALGAFDSAGPAHAH